MKGQCPRPLDERDTLELSCDLYREFGAGNETCKLWRDDPNLSNFSIHTLKFGAGNETRTRDPNLGKVVLYQLSYSRVIPKFGGA